MRRLGAGGGAPDEGRIQRLWVRVGVIGCGHWGPHLIRNLNDMPEVDLVGVAEERQDRLRYVRRTFPTVSPFSDHRQLLASDVDAVVIATPIQTHFQLVKEALLAGKHVLVEKPLACSPADAAELVDLAWRCERVLMVGDVFLYNPAVRELRRLVQQGELGRIYYADAARLNLGLFQPQANVVWDLAPHDIAILMYVLGKAPQMVSARGSSYVHTGVHDVCYLELLFSGGATGHVHVSWLDPDKVRRLTLVGDRRMAVYDDVSTGAKLRVYDSGVEYPTTDNYGEFELAYRHGQIVIPYIRWREPLRVECEHFVRCVRTAARPLSDGEHGLAVVAVLDAAERSLQSGGMRVPVTIPARDGMLRSVAGAHSRVAADPPGGERTWPRLVPPS
ncbi:MAG TPA: Gfo/Idh/MocA family oxidoreductase [Candidatus Dormibacteraeota bacterium]|nr:Gfo/Idh/MocA family oxidoreductase [Candidatus Dormibacteraeota bacterium]